MLHKNIGILFIVLILSFSVSFAQKPYRVGTTAANFLEIGYGTAGNAMGDAYVSLVDDISALYWNPAGMAAIQGNEVMLFRQPWIADISSNFLGLGIRLPRGFGIIGLGLVNVSYGEIEVTNLNAQEGTGEHYNASEYALSLAYARNLTNWFSFGASAKYIYSKIWYLDAKAFALDLGVIIRTKFFSVTGKRADGARIGMSISNYGNRMKYDGINLLTAVDILPDKNGNYKDVPAKFSLQAWELPLIFRIGMAVTPLILGNQRIVIAADALHTNNNSESVNIGAQYQFDVPQTGSLFLRAGYKALFMEASQYGLSLGAGLRIRFVKSKPLFIDYAFRNVGELGKTHSYSIRIIF